MSSTKLKTNSHYFGARYLVYNQLMLNDVTWRHLTSIQHLQKQINIVEILLSQGHSSNVLQNLSTNDNQGLSRTPDHNGLGNPNIKADTWEPRMLRWPWRSWSNLLVYKLVINFMIFQSRWQTYIFFGKSCTNHLQETEAIYYQHNYQVRWEVMQRCDMFFSHVFLPSRHAA